MNSSNTPTLDVPSSQSASQHEDRLRAILNLCKRMTSVGDVISLLELITIETKALLTADRVSIFLLDREKCELWSVISQEKRIMRFDARLGIAGSVAMTGQTINVADAYEHPLFYKELDVKTGYRTRTLLAVPLRNLRGEIIGVGEAMNKEKGLFTEADAEILQTLAAHVSDTIETTQLDRQLQDHPLGKENDRPEDGGFSTRNIVGMSYRMQSIIRLIDQIRDCSVDVLIEGESGTGKELVAKALHHASPRAKHPFVAVNCAALPDNLVEAELFGIEKGVATGVDRRLGKFEEAHGGTLFLDEIGDLSLPAQTKILRVLQERAVERVGGRGSVPIDIRVIAATNKNLEAVIKERMFREDLYYRLKVIHIRTPSLREVPEDIPGLANHFLHKYCQTMQTDPKQFTP
ncbi:MAG TPA: sigma-54-dependent Fis family transcriptional regulator, partial [Terriglobales bacterium]|nr:sigma-54-dependent Fis family transcriptional regulator [Terriglobales bacterium]